MEPTLQITLGSPPSEWARDLFEELQEKRRRGDFSGTTRWEEYETDFLRKFLLSRREGAPASWNSSSPRRWRSMSSWLSR